MKTDTIFYSPFADNMTAFVALRRLSGTDYASQARLLHAFDRFLAQQQVTTPYITQELYQRYLDTRAHLTPRAKQNCLSVVRQFCQYQSQIEPDCYIPIATEAKKWADCYRPYLLTHQEISRLLNEARLLAPRPSLRPVTYTTLFALLYSTGIRIGEARGLDIGDVYPAEQRLHIRQGKYRKARWVPLSTSMQTLLGTYLTQRQNVADTAADAPLFISLRRTRLAHPTIHHTFKRLCEQAHIGQAGTAPRLHDLRHTYAVHRLLQWYREGADLLAKLPILATYMGHVDIYSTQVYLHATPDLLHLVSNNFHRHYRHSIMVDGGVS